MALPPQGATFTAIELCAGVGMLGLGARAALRFLGHDLRTICYVEREAPAAAQLVALMEAGALAPAPIWSDLLTFDGTAWRGCVDWIIAGFPCQDISIAGRRAGLDGKRSGLFFDILDLADACGASGLFLENVSAIATATASAMDEAQGPLEERAAARVVGELADRGWNAEWLHLSASDVGASHGRERWFCIAWRMADTGHGRRADQPQPIAGRGIQADDCTGSKAMANTCSSGCQATGQLRSGPGQSDLCRTSQDMAHTSCNGRHQGRPESSRESRRPDATERSGAVADANDVGQRTSRRQGLHRQREEGSQPALDGGRMAHAGQPRLPYPEQPEQPGQPQPHGRRTAPELRGTPLFAPGPLDPRWAAIVANRPDLAPAVEPGVRLLADGMAYLVDESRAHQLRQVGNGVVPLQAAAALVQLLRRASAH